MAWHGSLDLHYRLRDTPAGARCSVADRHDGPLRVLAALYPEGPATCHSVLVHPPGGVAGGDTLHLNVRLDAGARALITTPGATRFYRSAGEPALMQTQAVLAEGTRLEWLPLETLVYPGALAENRARFELAPGAEMIGREVVALGLPAASLPFTRGRFVQHLEIPGVWLDRGCLDAQDHALLDSPLGLAGRRVLATQWFATGTAIDAPRRAALLEAARLEPNAEMPGVTFGSSSAHAQWVVLRALADRVEPATELLNRVWARWRQAAWGLPPHLPRVWRT